MKGLTIRFGDLTYGLLQDEARREGINLTAFIREAALARAYVNKARRGALDGNDELMECVGKLLEAERQDRLGRQ